MSTPSQDLSEPDDLLEISTEMFDATPAAAAPPTAPLRVISLEPADGPIDFERGMSMWPWLALVVIAICLAVFGWEVATGALESEEAIVNAGALHRESVMAGEVWRLFSATILHGSFAHLFGNMGMLYILALGCEHAFGSFRMAMLYLFSALTGSLASLAMTEGPSVGASGAIFGVAAGLVIFLYRFRDRYFIRNKQIGVVLLIWAAWTVGIGFLSPDIDNWAHIGGFAGGAIAGLLLPPRPLAKPVA